MRSQNPTSKELPDHSSSISKKSILTASRKVCQEPAVHQNTGVCVLDFITSEKTSSQEGRLHNKSSSEGLQENFSKDSRKKYISDVSYSNNRMYKGPFSLSCNRLEGESVNFLYNERPSENEHVCVTENMGSDDEDLVFHPDHLSRSSPNQGLDLNSPDATIGSSLDHTFDQRIETLFTSDIQKCPDEAFELRQALKANENIVFFNQSPTDNAIIEKEKIRQLSTPSDLEAADILPLDSSKNGSGLDFTSSLDCLQSNPPQFSSLALDRSTLFDFGRVDLTHLVAPWFVELVEAGHIQSVCTALLVLGSDRTRIHDSVSEAQVENWFYVYLDLLSKFRLWCVSTRIIKQCGSLLGGVDTRGYRRSSMGFEPPIRSILTTQNKEVNQSRSQNTVSLESSNIVPIVGDYRATKPSSSLARHVAMLNQTGTSMTIRCGKCSKAMQRAPIPLATPIPSSAINTETTSAIVLPTQSQQQTQQSKTQPANINTAWACFRHPSSENSLATCAVCHLTVRGLFLWCFGCSHGGHLNHMQAWLSVRCECPAGCGHLCEYGRTNDPLTSVRVSA